MPLCTPLQIGPELAMEMQDPVENVFTHALRQTTVDQAHDGYMSWQFCITNDAVDAGTQAEDCLQGRIVRNSPTGGFQTMA